MKNKASVAKWFALAVVPLSLTAVLANVAQHRRAEIATRQLSALTPTTHNSLKASALRELIAHGANVNVRGRDGFTPLHHAAYYDTDNAQVLLDRGADINARQRSGETPLFIAVSRANVKTVRLLLGRGADANLPLQESDGTTYTPLNFAMQMSDFGHEAPKDFNARTSEIIQLLKAAGAKE